MKRIIHWEVYNKISHQNKGCHLKWQPLMKGDSYEI